MAALRFTLSFFGETQIDRTLARFSDRARDARPAWDALADRFGALERAQFASEGRYSGGWAPLSPRYGEWKAEHYPGMPILERDGHLKASLTRRPFGVEVIEPGFMAVGSDVDYGAYHQQGTDRMPRRRPVEFPDSERRAWVALLHRFIVNGEV